ncbi:putative aminopeptidase [Tritrichomonas foetus]|uniref:Carboxypeptidase Q n=1 Tax=Tritrichomonas foetus TaxID=1144522 RepID=A0A1J4KR33_9EUKA|nr:putative aminopeptidase [Tritrichomonas foetus]|eukprot:OHT13562.1 putative aminopeptidase [Tritrichomonas foetus]
MSKDYRSLFEQYKPQQNTYINYVVQMINYVIDTVGSREPGSPDEHAGQELMLNDLKNYCDSVDFEYFQVHPKALLGWVVIDAFLLIAATFFYNMNYRLISFFCSLASVVILFFEFILYWEFVDFLFPKKTSSNVVGIRKPTGEVKRRAIFNGHTDSNYEWWYNYLGGGHCLALVVVLGLAGAVISLILQIILYKEYTTWYATLQLCFLPAYAALLFFTNWNEVVPGANDNLTGSVAAMAVAKYLADNDIRFENTEVRVVLTGCEESGLRGSKAYVKAHPPDDIETAFFAFDTLRDLSDMAIYTRDLTGTVQHDLRVCNIMKRAGQLGGLDLPFRTLFFGASDAAAQSQGGIPAGLFAAMDPTPASYYHTRRDTQDNLEPIAIGHGLDVAVGSLFIFNEEGLSGSN